MGTSWQGANGQSFTEIVQQLNAFLAVNPELVILQLSHDLDTDLGNSNYANFTQVCEAFDHAGTSNVHLQAQWDTFLATLQSSINHLYIAGTSVDLSSQTLGSYIGSGRAAVLVMFSPGNGSRVLSPQFAGKVRPS